MDIYVNYAYKDVIIEHLVNSELYHPVSHAILYDRLKVITLKNDAADRRIQICCPVSIEDTPQTALNNFDLTFVMNYYDGENIYSAFPNDVLSRSGGMYYVDGVTEERINKYVSRNFEIHSRTVPPQVRYTKIDF